MIWLCGLADLDMAFQFLKEIWIWVEELGDLKLLRCLTMKEVEIDKTSYLLNQRIPLHRRSVYIYMSHEKWPFRSGSWTFRISYGILDGTDKSWWDPNLMWIRQATGSIRNNFRFLPKTQFWDGDGENSKRMHWSVRGNFVSQYQRRNGFVRFLHL
jgi:hypothetical protein